MRIGNAGRDGLGAFLGVRASVVREVVFLRGEGVFGNRERNGFVIRRVGVEVRSRRPLMLDRSRGANVLEWDRERVR